MTHHDSLLNRVERLAKHIGRTDEIVARLQEEEYDLRHARDGAVRELQQVKADRDETEAKRKLLHEAVTQIFAELSQAAATFWPDRDPGTVLICTLTGEIERLRAEIETLRGAMAADDQRLRDAEERVWPGQTLGCDAAEEMADVILYLRQNLANAKQELSEQSMVANVETQQDAAIWQQQLDAARAEIDTLQQRLTEAQQERVDTVDDYEGQIAAAEALIDPEASGETTISGMADEILYLRQQLANAQRELSEQSMVASVETQQDAAAWQQQVDSANAARAYLLTRLDEERSITASLRQQLDAARLALTRERLDAEARGDEMERLRQQLNAAQAAVALQRAGIERLQAFVNFSRRLLGVNINYADVDRLRAGLAELDAGTTEPTPVAEPTPCPECERLRAELSENEQGRQLQAAEIERLDACIEKIKDHWAETGMNVRAAIEELEFGPPQPTPVAEPLDAEDRK